MKWKAKVEDTIVDIRISIEMKSRSIAVSDHDFRNDLEEASYGITSWRLKETNNQQDFQNKSFRVESEII